VEIFTTAVVHAAHGVAVVTMELSSATGATTVVGVVASGTWHVDAGACVGSSVVVMA